MQGLTHTPPPPNHENTHSQQNTFPHRSAHWRPPAAPSPTARCERCFVHAAHNGGGERGACALACVGCMCVYACVCVCVCDVWFVRSCVEVAPPYAPAAPAPVPTSSRRLCLSPRTRLQHTHTHTLSHTHYHPRTHRPSAPRCSRPSPPPPLRGRLCRGARWGRVWGSGGRGGFLDTRPK